MRRAGPARAVALAVALASLGCGSGPESSGPAGPAAADRPEAPASAAPATRATVSLEPPRLRIGDVATLELVVSTPPGHRLLPPAPPQPSELSGLWLLDVESLPPEEGDVRWVHRVRLRVRARDVGVHTWPALELEVEGPEGTRESVRAPAREIEVVSVLPEHPARSGPFGLLEPAAPAPGVAPLGWAAAGAAAALLAVASIALLRSARRRRGAAAPPRATARADARLRAGLREEIESTLRAAGARAADDPLAAADTGSQTLRRWVALRFGRDARCATTPELGRATPPWAARAAWPALVRVLGELDAVRFRPAPAPDDADAARAAAGRVRAALDDALRFVDDTALPGGRLP